MLMKLNLAFGENMRTLFSLGLLFLATPAFAITKIKVSTLPQSEWADTEVMTNVAINLSNSRTFSWRLEMDASPTNNVLIALGKDTNDDDELTPSEWETTFWLGLRGLVYSL